MKSGLKMAFLAVAATAMALPAQAQTQDVQMNFSISPPPLAWSSFEAGRMDIKMRLTYFSMDGSGIATAGAGVDGVFRSAFSDVLAATVQIGLFGMNGESDSQRMTSGILATSERDLSLGNFLLGVNLEVQPFTNDRVSAIFIAGPLITFLFGEYDSTETVTTYAPLPAGTTILTDAGSLSGIMYGAQGGGQIGFKLGSLHVDAFGMISSQEGSSTASTSFGDVTTDIPAATVVSVGLDLAYVPWGLTFSAMLQEIDRTSTTEAVRTKISQISWTF